LTARFTSQIGIRCFQVCNLSMASTKLLSMELIIQTPRDFSLKRTAYSHGWTGLLPFELDLDTATITRVLDLEEAQPVTVVITGAKRGINVRLPRKLSQRAQASITRDVRHILRLDDDLTEFYSAMKAHPAFDWIPRAGAGRLIRSPTVFEDLVKTICTTNCSWSLTKKMVQGLVNNLGRESADGRRAFPTPAAMAAMPASFYRDEVRAGYRAPYLKELAERVASGDLDVEGWLRSDLPTAELRREMKRVKGVGDYAAENLLKLLGRYDVLALDSWVRATFARTRNHGRATPDAKIARFYSHFNHWRGLALWCDMTRDWIEEQGDEKQGGRMKENTNH
jgi:3-methyladenine DNA glycosylase/8-oxoguanine DNA glycosylase